MTHLEALGHWVAGLRHDDVPSSVRRAARIQILEDRRGFWRRFSFLPMPFVLGALGTFWTLHTLQIKSYPGCHYFQTALEAIERLRARGVDLSLSSVRHVVIDTTKLACEATRFAAEYVENGEGFSPVGVNFSRAQSAAVMLAAGRLGVEELDAEQLAARAPEIRAWSDRIEVRHDPVLTGSCSRRRAGSRRGSERCARSVPGIWCASR